MNATELQSNSPDPGQDLYNRLIDALPECEVLAHVGVNRVREGVGRPLDNDDSSAETRQGIVDYLIRYEDSTVLAVVGVDDRETSTATDRKRDAAVAGAGFRVVRWHAAYLPDRGEIRSAVLPQRAPAEWSEEAARVAL